LYHIIPLTIRQNAGGTRYGTVARGEALFSPSLLDTIHWKAGKNMCRGYFDARHLWIWGTI